jgi:hypothetical protein
MAPAVRLPAVRTIYRPRAIFAVTLPSRSTAIVAVLGPALKRVPSLKVAGASDEHHHADRCRCEKRRAIREGGLRPELANATAEHERTAQKQVSHVRVNQ